MLSDWMLRLRALFRRTAVEEDIHAELEFHPDHQMQATSRAGSTRPRRRAWRGSNLEVSTK
jgi:hypothetical protein